MDMHFQIQSRQTIFCPQRFYRYTLWRSWVTGSGVCMFIGLNPSTADETRDDPTIRACVGFAKRWGYQALCMTNLFGYRATDPRDMLRFDDPVGEDNDAWLEACAKDAGVVVAAWGRNGNHLGRAGIVRKMIPTLHVLHLNDDGSPHHPLYMRKELRPVAWEN